LFFSDKFLIFLKYSREVVPEAQLLGRDMEGLFVRELDFELPIDVVRRSSEVDESSG
jgi:hypothetical protein